MDDEWPWPRAPVPCVTHSPIGSATPSRTPHPPPPPPNSTPMSLNVHNATQRHPAPALSLCRVPCSDQALGLWQRWRLCPAPRWLPAASRPPSPSMAQWRTPGPASGKWAPHVLWSICAAWLLPRAALALLLTRGGASRCALLLLPPLPLV
jgi:hypothetical protein